MGLGVRAAGGSQIETRHHAETPAVNLGGEGEVPGAINVQGPWILEPGWRSSREGKTLKQLQSEGHLFVVSNNLKLPFATGALDEVVTNSVPVDMTTFLGPGVQTSEVGRIIAKGGVWRHNAVNIRAEQIKSGRKP